MNIDPSDKPMNLTNKIKRAREYSYLGMYTEAADAFKDSIGIIKNRIKPNNSIERKLLETYSKLLKELEQEKSQNDALLYMIKNAKLPDIQEVRQPKSFAKRRGLPFNEAPFNFHQQRSPTNNNPNGYNNQPAYQNYVQPNYNNQPQNPQFGQYPQNQQMYDYDQMDQMNGFQQRNNNMPNQHLGYQNYTPNPSDYYSARPFNYQPNIPNMPNYRNMQPQQYKDPQVWDPPSPKPIKTNKSVNRKVSAPQKDPRGAKRNEKPGSRNMSKNLKDSKGDDTKKSKFLYHHYPDGVGPDSDLILLIEDYLMTQNPNITFDDIAGLDHAKEALKVGVLFPLMMKNFFQDIRKPPKGVLLYGPAGTGKTMLAKAIATTGKTTFFNVNPSTLASKWKGDSEKLVRLLFEMARFYAPTTIFIDEIDSLLSERSSTEHESSRKVKVQFFIEIDGIATTNNNVEEQPKVFILAATNRPWDLDEAILRRLSKRIYIPLPDESSRRKLFELKLKNIKLANDIEYDYLVQRTHMYNSDDIEGVCREASLAPFKRKLGTMMDDKSTQFFKDIEQEILEEEITMSDLRKALDSVKPSASVKYLERYEQWTTDHASV